MHVITTKDKNGKSYLENYVDDLNIPNMSSQKAVNIIVPIIQDEINSSFIMSMNGRTHTGDYGSIAGVTRYLPKDAIKRIGKKLADKGLLKKGLFESKTDAAEKLIARCLGLGNEDGTSQDKLTVIKAHNRMQSDKDIVKNNRASETEYYEIHPIVTTPELDAFEQYRETKDMPYGQKEKSSLTNKYLNVMSGGGSGQVQNTEEE